MSQPDALAAVLVPGWFPDPTGRFDLRWWDGRAWSDHVYGSHGYASDSVSQTSAGSRGNTGRLVPGIVLLAVSALPTAVAVLLLWFAVVIALSAPIEGMATFSAWFMSVLASVFAAVLAVVAIAVTQEEAVPVRARRTVLGLGLGVIVINAALVAGPIVVTLVGGTIE